MKYRSKEADLEIVPRIAMSGFDTKTNKPWTLVPGVVQSCPAALARAAVADGRAEWPKPAPLKAVQPDEPGESKKDKGK